MRASSTGLVNDTNVVTFLGLTLHPRSLPELNTLVEQGVRERQKWIIANHNLHSVYLFHRNPRLRDFYSGVQWTHIDGMPLVALGRMYGYRLRREQRVTQVDWIHPLMDLVRSRGWRVFFLGSAKEVAEKGAAELRRLHPGLQLEVNEGFFDARRGSAENEALVERINAYKPDLLMVGMGMPRQEYWTQDNFARLDAQVILSSNGAVLDYIAGTAPTPPRWAGRLGLEWAFRLAHEPRRLFCRYLVEPWYILALLMLDYPRNRNGVRLRARAGANLVAQQRHGEEGALLPHG